MGALNVAQTTGRDAVLDKIKTAAVRDHGLYSRPLAEEISEATGKTIHVGLNNADTDHVLLALLKRDPEKIFEGIRVAQLAAGADAAVLYLPEGETALADGVKDLAAQYQVTIELGIIDVRKAAEDLKMHLATAAALADLMEDAYVDGIYISPNGGDLVKTARDAKIGELVPLDGAKAVWMGYRYYTPAEAAELPAETATTGLVRILTDKDCIVDNTSRQMTAYRHASCGKCVFCREGLIQLEYEQKEITAARGKNELLDLAQEIGQAMEISTLCSVGKESAKAALDAIGKFGSEYEAHIKKNVCPAGVCQAFVHIYIDPATCTGCGDCLDVCPADCIEGKPKFIHMIDEFDCTKCGKCIEACEEDAIVMTSGKLPKLPNRLTKVGKFKRH